MKRYPCYILDENKNPVGVEDVLEWGRWFSTDERIVKQDTLPDGVRVSTVFLGLDHGYGDKPLLFETMVFRGEFDGYMDRYYTWQQAEEGHQRVLDMVLQGK